MIAFSFALPEESKGILRELEGRSRSGPRALPIFTGRLRGREVAVVHSGMGMTSATERIGDFLDHHQPSLVVASGFGGGLSADLQLGDIVVSQNFSSPEPLAGIATTKIRTGILITTRQVIQTAIEKKDLARHTGAIVVDMETAAIHRLCVSRGIPILALRAISDTAGDDLPVAAGVWFNTTRQRPRPLRLVLHLAGHPTKIVPFAKFVSGVRLAGTRLTDFLLRLAESLPADPEK